MHRCCTLLSGSRWLALPFLTACAALPPAAPPFPLAEGPPAVLAASAATHQDPAPMPAPAPRPAGHRGQNHIDLMFGGSYWSDFGDLDTSGAGPLPGAIGDFDSGGWAFDFGYDRVVWSGRDLDWSVGVETGWSTFDSDSIGYYHPYSSITGTMWYLAPATHWHFELSRNTTLVAGVGAGYYGFSIDELSTYYYGWWWGYDSHTLNQDDAFGGFASVAIDFEMAGGALRFENKLHYVEFGGLDALLPNESSVSGPIWTFEIGYAFKF
jgi:hypothetical protein